MLSKNKKEKKRKKKKCEISFSGFAYAERWNWGTMGMDLLPFGFNYSTNKKELFLGFGTFFNSSDLVLSF
jgi:hypothetical protein